MASPEDDELIAQLAGPGPNLDTQQRSATPWNDIYKRMATERESLPQRQMPASEAAPERDQTGMYWAMALDLLGNKGRNLGGIMQNDTAAWNKRVGDFNARNTPDAFIEREQKLAQLRTADRQGLGAEQRMLLDLRGAERADEQADDNRNHQDAVFAQTERSHLDDVDYKKSEQARHASEFEKDLAFKGSEGKANRGVDYARIKSQEQQARERAALELTMRADADAAQATRDSAQHRNALELHDKDNTSRENIAYAGDAQQKAAAEAAAAAKQRSDAATQSHQLSEEAEKQFRLIPDLNDALSIIDKYQGAGKSVPGLGKFQSQYEPGGNFSIAGDGARLLMSKDEKADQDRLAIALKNLQQFDIRELSGANTPEKEVLTEAMRVGGKGMREDQALQTLRSFENMLRSNFQSRASGREQAMRGALKPYGWDKYITDPNAPPAPTPGGTATAQTQATQPTEDPLSGINGLTRKVRR